MQPLYDDGRIGYAVAKGWILKRIDPDGVVRYILTNAGVMQYNVELRHRAEFEAYMKAGEAQKKP